jgi:hypothetical protein
MLTKNHVIKKYVEVDAQLHEFLNSALDGGNWSTSLPDYFKSGGWVGHTDGLDAVAN